MLKKRLMAIANLVKKDAIVVDVGTDHAYLPIYLSQNKIAKKIIATDISQNALDGAQKNIEKANIKDITLICTDGLNGIETIYDTLIISGMGASRIIGILDNHNLPDNIILSANNDYYKLRKYMNKIGYKIVKEIVVLENEKYYDIISYEKGKERLANIKLKYGISKDKNYYKYLYQKQKDIFKKVGFLKKIIIIKELIVLKKLSI